MASDVYVYYLAATFDTWAACVPWQQHWYFSPGYAFTLAFTLAFTPAVYHWLMAVMDWRRDGNVHRRRRVLRAGGAQRGAFAGWVAALCASFPLLDGSGVEADASALCGVGLVPVVLGVRLRALLAWTRAGAVLVARLCLS